MLAERHQMPHGPALLCAMALLACGGCVRPDPAPTRIVVITLDTTRADRLGCYGYDGGTSPNLDALAAESVLFEQVVSPVPTTLPSHATMFTGLNPQDHGVRYNLLYSLGPEAYTLAEALSEEGWSTAAFPASYVLDARFGLSQGFDTYVPPPSLEPGEGAVDPEAQMRPAGEGVDAVLEWLGAHAGERVFVWLHLYDPHAPYRPPFPYSSRFRDRPYDGEIAYADAELGRLLERLRDDDDWERTLLVVAGDHGEGLHDHGEAFHTYLVYETTQRVPLILRAPGAAPARVREPVALADLMPTVLDLAGGSPPPLRGAISLRDTLRGKAPPARDHYFESLAGALNYGWLELRGVRSGDWKLIDSERPELYDLASDPHESTNLADLEAERLAELREILAELSRPADDETPAERAQDEVLDPETEALLASLGYTDSGFGGAVEGAPHPRELVDLTGDMKSVSYAILGRQWPRVYDRCAYVLERDPTNKWAMTTIVMALLEMGRAREAQDHAARLLESYPEIDRSYATLARTYSAQQQPATAYDVLQRGLEKFPGSELLAYLALVAAFEAGRDTVCSEEVPRALESFEQSWRMLLLKARCEARAGELASALDTLRRATRLGFRKPSVLSENPDFEELARTPEFLTLVAEVELVRRPGDVARDPS